jgi:hypothetical protein
MSDMGGLTAPEDNRAVIVLESGVTVSLRLKARESYSVKRSVSEGKKETGYKVSDGVVNDTPQIDFEGIITGSDDKRIAYNGIQAASDVASIQNAFNLEELTSVYTSFIAITNAVITDFKAEASKDKKAININLSVKHIDYTTFQRTQGAPAKTKNPAGKGKTNTGKKSAAPVPTPQKDSALDKAMKAAVRF